MKNRVEFFRTKFPFQVIVGLFATLNKRYPLEHREVGFRVGERGDIFWRNLPSGAFGPGGEDKSPLSFSSVEELACTVLDRQCAVIEFGPIFPPWCTTWVQRKEARKDKRIHLVSPLKFDLDITDYSKAELRTCDCKAPCCNACWRTLVFPALRELHRILTVRLGYHSLLMFFSGSKGFHLYVMDERTYTLSDAQRETLYNVIQRESSKGKIPILLDREVTVNTSHCTKAPLQPHPVTGLIAQPWATLEEAADWFPRRDALHRDRVSVEQMEHWAGVVRDVIETI